MFATFTRWVNPYSSNQERATPVAINPTEVVDVVDFCGTEHPGQQITLKNKTSHLVQGTHAEVMVALIDASKSK